MNEKKLNNVKLLLYSDYYDGALKGLCEYENKIYRFETEKLGGWIEDDICEDRIYIMLDLEPWQLTYELYWHSLFVTNAASYTEFDKQLVNERFKIDCDFYEKQKKEYKKIDYTNNKIIGYFKL
jgi:hypothetical protein